MVTSWRGVPDAVTVVPDFFPEAGDLRSAFEARVGPDRAADPGRFVWDYWYVPDQYAYLRTQPRRLFPAPVYQRWSAAVRSWGRQHLGCVSTSEPWLSLYVDGCGQELHADVPQGPWAYVYSLTPDADRGFTGGETVLIAPRILDYWSTFDPSRALELPDVEVRVPVRYDQLVVFDARVPHGVARVRGTRDPLLGRVVLHGWFLPPRLAVDGPLRATDIQAALAPALRRWAESADRLSGLTGLAVWRLLVADDGAVTDVTPLGDTLVRSGLDRGGGAVDELRAAAATALAGCRFPAAGASTVIVPLSATAR